MRTVENMELKHLKSGSDVRGTAIETTGQPITLTDEAIKAITEAFVYWLKKKSGKNFVKVALGHDSRLSADRICSVVNEILLKTGCDVYSCGLCSTPSIFMMTRYPQTDCDAGIMITASHHPFNKNGLKFFTKAGGLDGKDISEILDIANSKKLFEKRFDKTVSIGEIPNIVQDSSCPKGKIIAQDFMKLYCDVLVDKVISETGEEKPLKSLKIVVDAGNGAGGFYAERILKVLGADVSGSQFLSPDGNFPNHIPNPEDKEAMRSISACVKANNADLGVIFDTDVDRAAIVSADGEEINRNKLIALISSILLEEQPRATIVTDSVTSDGLADYITSRGGEHHRFKRGYKNVIDEAVRLNNGGKNAVIAIETSGHAALKENYFLDDGAYLVTRIIIKMAQLKKQNKSLDDLISDLKMPLEEKEVRLTFNCENFIEYGNMLIDNLKKLTENSTSLVLSKSNHEGVRVNVLPADGWFLVRMSVHDPIMPINIESNVVGGSNMIAKFLWEFMSQFSGVNSSALNNAKL